MNGGAKPILIADDNSFDAQSLKRIIVEIGIANPIEIVSNADAVIDWLAGQKQYVDRTRFPYPVFLFLDLVMPEKPGMEVLHWLQKQTGPEHKSLGIVVITAMGNIAEISEAYRLGAHSFLLKPLIRADLLNLVNSLRGIRFTIGKTGRQLDFILR